MILASSVNIPWSCNFLIAKSFESPKSKNVLIAFAVLVLTDVTVAVSREVLALDLAAFTGATLALAAYFFRSARFR